VELETLDPRRSRSLTVAAITHVFTIARVAEMLGEDEDRLREIAMEMEPEDGYLWIIGTDDTETPGFTRKGIENLKELIAIRRTSRDRS
jgi:hypothetical protein